MPLQDAVSSYFQGEKIESLVFVLPLGLLSVVFGTWLLAEAREAFARGVGWPFVVLGLALSVTGAAVGFRTPGQVERLEAALSTAPREALVAEQARMAKVNAAWPRYAAGFAALALGGIALRFAVRNEFGRGVGVACMFFAGVGFLIDGFAERRAQLYTASLVGPAAPAK